MEELQTRLIRDAAALQGISEAPTSRARVRQMQALAASVQETLERLVPLTQPAPVVRLFKGGRRGVGRR